MPTTFARMKLRLLRNALRGSTAQRWFFGLSVGGGALLALVGFGLLAGANPFAEADRTVMLTRLAFVGICVGWSVLPLFGFGIDQSVDPERLALLPLRIPLLVTGLTVASLIGIAPVATTVALSGVLPASAASLTAFGVAVVAIVCALGMCIAFSRLLTTALSSVLRSRRGKDLATFALVTIVSFSVFAAEFAGRFVADIATARGSWFDTLLRALPPGWLADAVLAARPGGGGVALWGWRLVAAVAVVAVSFAAWGLLLRRTDESVDTSTLKRDSVTAGLFPSLMRRVRRDRAGAVAAREARYVMRDPRIRANTTVLFVFGVGFIVAPLVTGGDVIGITIEEPGVVLFAALSAWIIGLQGINQFGFDAGSYWMQVVATGDPGDDLRGKNIVAMTIATPILVASACLLAAFNGGWLLVPVAVGVGFGAVCTALGVGNVVSVLAPLPVAGEGENYFAQRNTGQGCATGLVIAVAMLVLVTLWLPLAGAVAASWFVWKPGLVLCVAFALAWGEMFRRIGLRTASRDLLRRQPEVLRAIGAEAVG